MKPILSTLLILFIVLTCSGQTIYPTRDSVHIFWQPGLKITYSDYKGTAPAWMEKEMAKYGYSAAASVGIWRVLDVAKKDDKFEKAYFAPAFERTTSVAKTNDSLQIAMQNISFDICEIWARWARQQLKSIKDSMNAIGAQAIMYTTIVQEMDKKRLQMYDGYIKEVMIDKKEGMFEKWRTLIDKMLDETKIWATSPEECYRLMTGKPIEKGYIKAKKLIGPMADK